MVLPTKPPGRWRPYYLCKWKSWLRNALTTLLCRCLVLHCCAGQFKAFHFAKQLMQSNLYSTIAPGCQGWIRWSWPKNVEMYSDLEPRRVPKSTGFWLRYPPFYSVIHISIAPRKELCSKMALGEVGVSLPWWCHALVLPPPGYWGLFSNLIIFS